MADMRYVLRHGDPTSTGGTLIAIRPNTTHSGLSMALEGDVASCPVCNSNGPVFNNCFPNFEVSGRQTLVSGARVHCACQVKPTVMASQHDFTVEVNRSGSGTSLAQAAYYAGRMQEGGEVIRQHVEYINAKTGEAVSNVRYDLYVNGDLHISSEPMRNGRTRFVHGPKEISIVLWNDEGSQ
ncbi:PAAR domain-containing protein [Cupriavidus oxalaticus]|uniref:PAAR domain-containing protein n=1 Tax=Cupriavidus oxalaticus TaxID=96344 RepID=UPI003D1794B2